MSSAGHDCWDWRAVSHPWIEMLGDVACGYDGRLTDPNCYMCHRAREESPLDQLQRLDSRHGEDGINKDSARP